MEKDKKKNQIERNKNFQELATSRLAEIFIAQIESQKNKDENLNSYEERK